MKYFHLYEIILGATGRVIMCLIVLNIEWIVLFKILSQTVLTEKECLKIWQRFYLFELLLKCQYIPDPFIDQKWSSTVSCFWYIFMIIGTSKNTAAITIIVYIFFYILISQFSRPTWKTSFSIWMQIDWLLSHHCAKFVSLYIYKKKHLA